MVSRLWPPERDAPEHLRQGVRGWTSRREAILDEGKGGVDRGRPYQLEQLAIRIEAPALIAWWAAEVLNNGLAECCSHCRVAFTSWVKAKYSGMPPLPRAMQPFAAVCHPSSLTLLTLQD